MFQSDCADQNESADRKTPGQTRCHQASLGLLLRLRRIRTPAARGGGDVLPARGESKSKTSSGWLREVSNVSGMENGVENTSHRKQVVVEL